MRVAERACVLDPVEVLRLSEFELCRFVSAVPKKSSFATAAPRPARRESERVIFMQSCAVVQCAVYSELVNRREKQTDSSFMALHGFTDVLISVVQPRLYFITLTRLVIETNTQ